MQTTPQSPQFAGSSVIDFSQPLTTLLSQLAQPDRQVGLHAELTHAVLPWSLKHLKPQLPQLFTSSVVEVSQPSSGS
ncbi:hypothetical protein EO238_26210, partial [Citrobacter sp. AAK_AS5]